jgi:hypothetical protein
MRDRLIIGDAGAGKAGSGGGLCSSDRLGGRRVPGNADSIERIKDERYIECVRRHQLAVQYRRLPVNEYM